MPSAGPGASFAYNRLYLGPLPAFQSTARSFKTSLSSKLSSKKPSNHMKNCRTWLHIMALVNGEKSPLAVKLVKQSAAKMKSVTALVSHNEYTIMN